MAIVNMMMMNMITIVLSYDDHDVDDDDGHDIDACTSLSSRYTRAQVGWPLGAILFEINSLPWTYNPEPALLEAEQSAVSSMLTVMLLIVLGAYRVEDGDYDGANDE